ncbi:hypothetical protein ACFL4G_12735, partial [Thermodesulfobacteriota bacterium]
MKHELVNHELVEIDFKEILYENRPCLDKNGEAVEGLYNAWISLNNPKQYNSYTTNAVKEIILTLLWQNSLQHFIIPGMSFCQHLTEFDEIHLAVTFR